MVKASDIVLVLVAILFPPAAAGFLTGCSCDLLINIALTCLGYIPGHIHAFYLIYKNAQAEERYGNGNYKYTGNGEYVPVEHSNHHHIIPNQTYHQQQQQQAGYQPPPSYGATQ